MSNSMQQSWRIRGGRVVDPHTARNEDADLDIVDGRIAAPGAASPAAPLIDARGLTVVPGLVDLHVHFREPGDDMAETIASGSLAAARGGFTTVVTMPNTRPATDSAAMIRHVLEQAQRSGHVRVMPSGCITRGRQGGGLADLVAMRAAGAAAFTDDGAVVADDRLMQEAMTLARGLDVMVMDHALDPVLSGAGVMHEGEFSRKYGLPGISVAAETRMVARDIACAAQTGAAVHIQHLSCAESVALVRRAQQGGVKVTAEATPHHLALCDADVDPANADYKMSPPLRAASDRDAVVAAVVEGMIAAFATDHAPHTATAKARGFAGAPFGIVGLETAVGVTYTVMVKSGRMGLLEWLRRWTTGPAGMLGIKPPSLAVGMPADIAILDLHSEWTVRAADFASRSRNTPFEGWRLTGRAVHTFLDGRATWRAV
jgi:dihydroorotase